MVVDCVNDERASIDGYIARSYFTIESIRPCRFPRAEGRDLVFSEYYFCDGETPVRLRISPLIYGKKELSPAQILDLKGSPSYAAYRVSETEGPVSIDNQDWRTMLEMKQRAINARMKSEVGLLQIE